MQTTAVVAKEKQCKKPYNIENYQNKNKNKKRNNYGININSRPSKNVKKKKNKKCKQICEKHHHSYAFT